MPHSIDESTSTQAKMSRPSSTSTYSNNACAKQTSTTLTVPDATTEPQSPVGSQFSFASLPHSVQAVDQPAALSSERPGTRGTMSTTRRAQYYEDQFAYKNNASSARERVSKDAPIIADLQTNVIIKDEYTLVTDLSHHLSSRYQRPESSIMITVNHSACLLLGGSFEPTYVLTITALPMQLQPTTNKRNAALIQNFICESIGVPADRGILKFVPIHEENLSTNGMTILGEIERLERIQCEENGGGVKRALTKSRKSSIAFKTKSSNQLTNRLSLSSKPRTAVTPPLSSPGPFDSGVAVNDKTTAPLQPIDSKINHMKSTPVLSTIDSYAAAPTIPTTKSSKANMSKRKSLLQMFRR